MSATTMVHVRLDEETRDQAASALKAMGMSVSEAVRVFLRTVAAEQAFPFPIKVPNAVTQQAMEEARHLAKARHAGASELFDALGAETKN